MFTSISSYIWGGAVAGDENPSTTAGGVSPTAAGAVRPPRDPSPFEGGEDWVLVGGSNPAPGNLSGALEPLPSSLNSSPASSAASEAAGDDDDEDDDDILSSAAVAVAPSSATRLPSPPVRGHQDLALLAETRAVRAGQSAKQRAVGKALSSKALKRANMLATSGGQRRQLAVRHSMPLKMAGANKNLKQC